jgi:hypothetical protein
MACTACLVVIVSFVSARQEILAVKVGISIDLPRLPCWPTCLRWPTCLVNMPALFVSVTSILVEVGVSTNRYSS